MDKTYAGKDNKNFKYNVEVRSKIHPNIRHIVEIDFKCRERMPSERCMSETHKKTK